MALTKYQLGFTTTLRTVAEKICPEFGIPPQVCVAQAILETGWGGANKESAKGKTFGQFGKETGWNLFGIKGAGDAGSQNWKTKEYKGTKPTGEWVTITAAFAKYKSLESTVRAYCTLLSKDRYKLARTHFSGDPGRYVTYVWASGYATAPNYPDQVMSIMRTVAKALKCPEFDVNPDTDLKAVITKLQAEPFGKQRISIRDIEMKNLFGLADDMKQVSDRSPASSGEPFLDVDHDGIPDHIDAWIGTHGKKTA